MTQDQQKAVFFQGGASPVTDLCVVLHNNKALQVVELPWVDKTGGGVTAKKSSLEPDSRVRARAGLSKGQDSKGYLGISFRSQTQASACHCFPRSAPEGFCVCRSRRSPGCPCSTELSV